MESCQQKKPNVIFILSDDQGAWAMGCSGNDEVRTPNLDRLAAQGIRFDNFFCTSPVCSPARASILTGRIPSQHGVHDALMWQSNTSKGGLKREVPADKIGFLDGIPSYPDLLRLLGYNTCFSGKWHLGDSIQPKCGFETWNPMPYGGTNYYNVPLIEDGHLKTYTTYASEVFTDKALEFLDCQHGGERPFCLALHYTAPHAPWGREHHPVASWDEYHTNCSFNSIPKIDESLPSGFNASPITASRRKRTLAGYFTALEEMDFQIGRLIEWLERKNLREDTLIVFMSDNGMNMCHHGIIGKGNATWPQNMFDTSVKVPCLISRPGYVPENEVNTDLLSQYDWLPTLMEYIGAAEYTPTDLPGRSFAPILSGEAIKGERSIYVFDEYGPVRMIRSKDWKLVWRYPGGPHELYNISNDPNEAVNLFNTSGYADLIHSLQSELEKWFAKNVDPQLDGVSLPITGRGQLGPVGDTDAFAYRFPWLEER